MILKAGKYKATQAGYIHDRIRAEGDVVELSEDFIDRNPKFTSSWLELVELFEPEAEPVDDAQVVREQKEAVLREKLDSMGVEVDGRWGLKKLQDELNLAEERSGLEDDES